MKTANLAIMFTDIQGYTERTSNSSRETTTELLKAHNKLLMPIIMHFRGRLVKTIGDAFLVVFASPTAAVLCGTTIQDALFKYNYGKNEEEQIHLRVAINVGEVILTKGDVFGEAVNIASRVENITPAEEVYLTQSVYLSMNKTEIHVQEVGHFNLKGIPEAVTVYCVPRAASLPTEDVQTDGTADQQKGFRPLRRRNTEPMLMTLPFGGQHLTEIESTIITPKRKKQLLCGFSVLLLAGILTLTIPSAYHSYQWDQVEQAIGRGHIERALIMLDGLPLTKVTDGERYFNLKVEIATRFLERQSAEEAAILLSKLTPLNFQDRSTIFRLELKALEQMLASGQIAPAISTIERLNPSTEVERRALNEDRVKLAKALLKMGRFEDLAYQVEQLQAVTPSLAISDILAGHLHVALSQRGNTFDELQLAFNYYDKALRAELSMANDELLLENIAHAFEELQENERQQRVIIGSAAALVDKYLGQKAINPLLNQLDKGNNNKIAREGLTNELSKLGASNDVDHIKLASMDLSSSYCNNDKNRRHTMQLIDRLRELGGNDERALGALLKFASRQNGCQAYAMQAIQRLVGQDVNFITKNDRTLAPLLEELSNATCGRRKNNIRTNKLLAQIQSIGDLRAIGPILALAQKSPSCQAKALQTAGAILGTQIQFSTSDNTSQNSNSLLNKEDNHTIAVNETVINRELPKNKR